MILNNNGKTNTSHVVSKNTCILVHFVVSCLSNGKNIGAGVHSTESELQNWQLLQYFKVVFKELFLFVSNLIYIFECKMHDKFKLRWIFIDPHNIFRTLMS